MKGWYTKQLLKEKIIINQRNIEGSQQEPLRIDYMSIHKTSIMKKGMGQVSAIMSGN